MWSMRFAAGLALFAACRSAPPGPTVASVPAERDGASATVAIDAGLDSAGPDAAPPPTASTTLTLYEQGKFSTVPAKTATERDGCLGTPEALAACKRLRPRESCDLAPWLDAAEVHCSGTPVRPVPPGPPTACGCTCSDAYRKSYIEWSKRSEECANVP